MAPSWAAEQAVEPTVVDDAPGARLPRRRPAGAAAPDGRRPRSFGLDSLAIGAPLTAAFVGALLAEGGHAAGGAPAGQGEASGVRGPTDAASEAGARSAGGLPQLPAGSGGTAASGGSSGQQAAVADGAAAPAVGVAGLPQLADGGGGRADGAASEVSAGISSKADAGSGISVGMTLVSLGAGPADEGAPDDGDDTGGGTIGDHVTGSDGDDVIHGTPGDDTILGGDGDDVIHGHAGDDLLDGGNGDDELHGGPGDDTLLGGAGHDQLFGGTGDDDLLGGTGNDQLHGEAGDDTLDGGAGDDLLDGGSGADQLQGGTGDDLLGVDNLHDVALDNTPGPDGGGSDTLQVDGGFSESLAAVGRPEDVTFVFSEVLFGERPAGTEAYTQQVAPGIEHLALNGAANHDVLGDSKANHITGNDGDNMIFGRAGDDILSGGAGADWLDGGAGRDRLEGGAGDDILNGGAGSDQLYGGAGDDTFVIGLNDSAVDTVFDHEGSNTLSLEGYAGGSVQAALVGNDLHLSVADSVVAVLNGYRGHEDAFAGVDLGDGPVAFADLLAPGPASALTAAATSLTGRGGEDLLGGYLSSASLTGGSGTDWLSGTDGADWLSGRGGDDHLQGGAGNDVLEGGAGSDLLEGGAGADRYLFRAGDGGLDTIRDAEGSNVAELQGVAGARLEGAVVGNDLYVVADQAPVLKVENFVGHEAAFAGVQTDDGFVPTDDLFGN